jgi:vacuolar-type H+-ATPase subunit I/STV1
MSQNNAREAMQGAKRDYPEYTWEMESGFSSGEFMLHGHNKDGSSRNIVPVLPQKETSDSLRRQIDELRVEAARLLSESEKTKRAAEKLAERIKRIEKTAL